MAAASSTPASQGTAPDIHARVRVAQMRMIFEQTSVAMLAATAFAFALALHLRGEVSDQTLFWWLVVKVAVVVPRVIHSRLFLQRKTDAMTWLSTGKLMLFLDGLVWGAAGVWLMPPGDTAAMTVVVATLAGVSAIAAFVLHADWPCCVAYTAPMQLPGAVGMLLRGDSFGLYGAFSILVFYTLLLLATRRSERHIVEMLRLRFTNEELTHQLSSALQHAQIENRAKNEFVANMSHELRTPLHGILGISNILLSGTPGSDQRESLTVIRRCGEHLLGLINNILEYSRFGAHGIELHPQQIDLTQVIDDTIAMCTPGAEERGLSLSCANEMARPCMVVMDPFRLRQILLNLVGNAVKFTERGTVHVRVTETEGGNAMLMRVEDTGVGIAPSALDRIFEPFVQVDTSNTRRFGGTGLGLSITRAICVAMGGRITYHSKLGQGSTFEVALPLKRLRPQEAISPVSVSATRRKDAQLHGVVLLAEDNEVNAIVAEASLTRLGLSVQRVPSGVGAVERVCQTHSARPDLVLLDCQMPEMDGFEAARRIREHEAVHALPRIPLIALTANVFPEDRDQCRAAGMDDFLAKPFTSEQLREMLESHLAQMPSMHS